MTNVLGTAITCWFSVIAIDIYVYTKVTERPISFHYVISQQPAPILRVQPLNVGILLLSFIICTQCYINSDENGIECEAGNTRQDSN
jgi:formate hydrogenlyase subunit 3/multisubunit Na+/H+ antiporter MnhD subunit